MGRVVKSLLEVQNKCVNLSSFVQDFPPIIYNSVQLSFTNVPFPTMHAACRTRADIHPSEP